jgi:RND family efflux transporter MFP subunit
MNTRLEPCCVLLILALLASAACVRREEDRGEERQSRPVAQLARDQVKVTREQQSAAGIVIGNVELRSLPEVLETTAQVEIPTGRSALVLPPVPGYVDAPPAGIPAIGSSVKRGQILAIVRQAFTATDRVQLQANLEDANAAIKTAEAQRAPAQSQLERSRRLYRDKIAPLKQVQQDEAALAVAQAAYLNAVARRGNNSAALSSHAPAGSGGPAGFVVTAPITGLVVSVDITPGQLVEPAHALFSLVDISLVWVKVPVVEAELGSVGRTGLGELTVSAWPGEIFRIQRVASSPVVDASTHTATLIYSLANPRAALKPGMVASVRLQSSRVSPRVTVPAGALVHESDATVVFLQIGQDTFRPQPVTVSFMSQDVAAIEAGLQPAQRVVLSGAAILEGGALVAILLFVFMRSLRTAAISLVAIPLSLLTAVLILVRSGASLNTMTLGGLVLALGEVVDDAIIDVENISRRLRENRSRPDPLPLWRVVYLASTEVRDSVV